ncbi:MAG TPA: hypothetical protein VEL03_00230 [Streptosporangiaceae bacterium]|nr:hypothetical protein [Streptosporangiaceae bacterium]
MNAGEGGAGGHGRAGTPLQADGWRAAWPELLSACILVGVVAGAGYAWAGAPAALLILAVAAVGMLALLRSLTEAEQAPPPPAEDWQEHGRTLLAGFWRKRGVVKDATDSQASYELELRVTLQHLLAARLAERHGISLYADPDAARRLLLTGTRNRDLWYWLDPARPADPDHKKRGIPPRTLAAIITRLEQL